MAKILIHSLFLLQGIPLKIIIHEIGKQKQQYRPHRKHVPLLGMKDENINQAPAPQEQKGDHQLVFLLSPQNHDGGHRKENQYIIDAVDVNVDTPLDEITLIVFH